MFKILSIIFIYFNYFKKNWDEMTNLILINIFLK